MADSESKLLFWLVLLAVLAGAGWYFRDLWLPQPEQPIVEVPAVEAEAPIEDAGPQHLIEPPAITTDSDRSSVPLPPLDDSDAYFLLDVGNVFGTDIEALLLREGIIDRLVATVDNLQRKQVPQKIQPWLESIPASENISQASRATAVKLVCSAPNVSRPPERENVCPFT